MNDIPKTNDIQPEVYTLGMLKILTKGMKHCFLEINQENRNVLSYVMDRRCTYNIEVHSFSYC
jgi:hypothetical protein